MKRLLTALYVCAATALAVHPAAAQTARTRDVPTFSQRGAEMKKGESYYITYSCRVKVDLRDYLERKGRGWNPITAATLVVAIVDGTANVDGNAFVAGSSINPKIVFSVASDRGEMATNDPKSCNGALIAQGSDTPKLAYFLKFNRGTVPSAFSTALSSILTVVGPIFKLVKDNAMAAKDAENIEQVQSVVAAYNSYLALFTAPDSRSDTKFLKIGRNVLETEAAVVEVNVRKVDSFLTDNKVPFTEDYSKLFKTNTTYAAENLSISCQYARLTLADAGFRNPNDQAYIIYRSLNASAIKSKADFVNCLGPALVRSVVTNRRLYLKHIPDELLVSESTLQEAYEVHKAETVDGAVRGILYQISTIAGSSAGGMIPQDRLAGLQTLAEQAITVNDLTDGQILSPGKPPASIKSTTVETAAEQFSKLIAAKYTRFGCFSLTRSEKTLDGLLDGATAVMLATSPATKDVAARTVALRMFVNRTKLTRFDITDNWVSETKTAFSKEGRACSI